MKFLAFTLLILSAFVIGQQVQDRSKGTKYATLVEWIQRNDGGLFSARIQSVPGMGMGVVTTKPVKEGELITRTPLTALINIEHAWASNDFGPIADDLSYLSNVNVKSLFVHHERLKSDSLWKPYLDSLPSDIHTTLFFDEEELAALQSSMVKEFALNQQEAANKIHFSFYSWYCTLNFEAYLKIKADLKSRHLNILPNFTRVDFYWGLSMWSSRAHTIGVKDRDGRWDRASCLVPLADLFNMALHQEQVNVVCNTNEASTHFECRTSKPLAAGEQLLVNYGADPATRHNGRLLMHYGFVVHENPLDSVSLKLPELNQELPDYAQRTKLAQKLSVLSNTVFQLSRPQDPFFTVKELLIAFRLIEGAPSDVKAAGLDPNGSFAKPFSLQNEKKVIRAAMNYLKKVLVKYNTTAEEDRAILSNGSLSSNAQYAVMLRMEEKVILMQNIAYLKGLLISKTEL